MRKSIIALMTVAFGMTATTVSAAETTVIFEQPDEYQDIEAVNSKQDEFEQMIMEGLRKHIVKLGEELPEGYNLEFVVTDLDLAGRVEPTFGATTSSYMRVLDRIDYPMIEFRYKLTDAQGENIKSGDERLRDMGITSTMRAAKESGRDVLYYEKEMLSQWFDRHLKPAAKE
ncbi:DUF3016 domain-containing protein [Pseudidiomarina salinarum]|uniref:DUF3016 domain-containing protein n=1 Tax=Pseudidiomarina salinarum TaxID=435908 RepID=UPI00069074CB|nr:DUF3016 domain-containing protein [Pseudidiomarina salinarum]RUO69013.1 DUF3016 domain-containing protein [Pseudidiomarina salinarum]